jgi:hypothetical protein
MEDASETLVGYERLIALTSQIFQDQLQMRAAGIEVRGWTPDRAAGVVQMRVASDLAAAQAYMDETYGAGRVIVVRALRPPASRAPR